MRVLPILFNTEMVRAILDERKKCTRRIVKIPNYIKQQDDGLYTLFVEGTCYENQHFEEIVQYLKKPYQPGDILYVRETWCGLPVNEAGHMRGHTIYYYKADGELRPKGWRGTWHPSIHMPKEAARIWLRVTNVRVERLQEITENGAKAEGISEEWARSWWKPTYNDPDSGGYPKYRDTFAYEVWDSTIKKSDLDRYGWDANPFVWVVSFERCEKPEVN